MNLRRRNALFAAGRQLAMDSYAASVKDLVAAPLWYANAAAVAQTADSSQDLRRAAQMLAAGSYQAPSEDLATLPACLLHAVGLAQATYGEDLRTVPLPRKVGMHAKVRSAGSDYPIRVVRV